MATIDLHAHSVCSDGELTPEALVLRAAACGLQVLALTDHDSVAGCAPAMRVAATCDLHLLAGVELSTQWLGVNVHIIALGLDLQAPPLLQLLERQAGVRERRAVAIGERLAALGFAGVYEAALARSASVQSIGRLHFAQVLQERGVVRSVQQAFDRYLGTGRKAAVPLDWIGMEEGVAILNQVAKVTVLAHPLRYGLSRTRLTQLLTAFAQAGGRALEVATPVQLPGEWPWLLAQATKHALFCSQGSDFHGPSTPWAELGGFAELPDTGSSVWRLLSDDRAA